MKPTVRCLCLGLLALSASAPAQAQSAIAVGLRVELRFGPAPDVPWRLTLQGDPRLTERLDVEQAMPFAFRDPLYADYSRGVLLQPSYMESLLEVSWLPQGRTPVRYEWHLPWSSGIAEADFRPFQSAGQLLSAGTEAVGGSLRRMLPAAAP